MSVHRYELPPVKGGGRPRVRWRVNYDDSPHPDGRRNRRTAKGFLTKAEARAFELKMRGEVAAGIPQPSSRERLTVAGYLRAWYAGVAVKASTRAHYRNMCEWYLVPKLGGIPLEKLSAEHVDQLYRWLETQGGRDEQGLSAKTVRLVHVTLHRALAVAVERGHVRRNVAALAHPPSHSAARSRKAERVWTAAQVGTWLAWLRQQDDRLYGVWHLASTTGMRRGELAGLHWADVDLESATVKVRWELTEAANRAVWVDGAKTRAGERTLDLDAGTVAVLKAHRARQAEEKLKAGPAYHDLDLVCCWEDGSQMWPGRLLDELHRHTKSLNLPRITVHGLRHTYATIAREAGVDYRVLQERLGHASASTTLDVYGHVDARAHREAAERIAKRITG